MTVLLAHQAVSNPATVVGAAVVVPNITVDPDTMTQHRVDQIRIEAYHAFNAVGANTNPQSILIQTSISVSGTADWVTVVEFVPSTGTTVSEVLTATEPQDETSIAMADASKFAAGGLVYIRDTVATDSEWAFVQEVDTTPAEFTILVDGLTTAHALTTSAMFDLAEKFVAQISVKGVERIRCVYMNEGGTANNTHVQVEYVLITTD